MINKNMKRFLSSLAIAVYMMVYSVPAGLCYEAAQMHAAVNKPALRGNAPYALKLEGDISLTKGNPKISLSLRDSDVKQVLRMFADKAGLNIVFHDSVDGKVTLDLVNVPLNDAFKLVMQVTNLTYFVDKNTMVVASAKESPNLNIAKQEMVSIPVKYTDASVVADFLNKNIFSINKPGLSNAQIVVTNPSANEVLIFGTDNDVKMAQKIINKFDVKPVSTTFVVNHTTPKEMSNLICNLLMPSKPSGGGASSGKATGGAASSSSSSSSSSVESLALGAGEIACEYENPIAAGSLSSLAAKSMIVSYFTQRGTINIMGGSVQQLDMIKDFIEKNDKKQPQAYLEISIIELNEDGTRQFDNTWQVWSKYFSGSFNGATKTNDFYPAFLKGDGYTVVDKDMKELYKIEKFVGTPTLTYAINYIIENKKGRILANPRIMITNGQTSTIDLTSDYVKTVKSEVLASSIAGGTQRTYEIGNDDGIKVEMVPFISPDGYVTLNIKPEYATVKEKVYAPSAVAGVTDLAATLLQRRNLDLKNIRIKDGETLVIGGMIREDEQKTVSKIPVLGDLPGVGFFFRNSATTKVKSELVIMITPKIIKDSEDIGSNSGVTL